MPDAKSMTTPLNRTKAREFRRSLRAAHRASRHDGEPFWRFSAAMSEALKDTPEDHPLRANRLRLAKLHGELLEAQTRYRVELSLLAMLVLDEDRR